MKIEIRDEGSIVLFTPLDAAGRQWLDENVQSEPWQWQGSSLAVDHRMAGTIRDAIVDALLEDEEVPP